MFDEYAHVISIKGDNAIVIGSKYLTPLEVILRKGTSTEPGEKLYIGKDRREKVYSIRRRVTHTELKNIDEEDFLSYLNKIVTENDSFFTDFINNSKPQSINRHQLQLLSNIGEKNLNKILTEREKKQFTCLDDVEKRTELNVKKSITNRIFVELTNPDEKVFLFVKKTSRT